MPQINSSLDLQPAAAGYMRGNEHGDLPVDDPPPAEHPSENYAAWKATAIFELLPFSSPPSR
jgi:hypothetical protein